MKQASYLWQNQRGIYFFRARIPKRFIQHFGTSQIKKTLKTDSYRLAVKLARAYRVELDKEMEKLEKGEYSAFTVTLVGETKATLPNGEKVDVTGKIERLERATNEDKAYFVEQLRKEAERIEERARKDELHKAQLAAITSAPQTTPPKPSSICSIPLSLVIERFIENKVLENKWSKDSSTYTQGMARLGLLLEIVGDKPSTELTENDAIKVEDILPKIPKNRNQGELAKLSDLQAKIGTDTAIYSRLDRHTQNRHWKLFKELTKFAKQKKYIEFDIAQDCRGISFSEKEAKVNQWQYFTDEDLQKIFNGYVYQSTKPSRINKNHDYYFWLPLLAAFTGARINELSQLLLTDIKQYKDIWYLDITDEDERGRKVKDKSVKTEAGKRKVPIHSKLIELGFLDFIKQSRTGGNANMVFSDGLTFVGGRWGNSASRWFNGYSKVTGYKAQCGISSDDKKVFHSFRKSFASNLYSNGVSGDDIALLIGHEKGGKHKTTEKYYIQGESVQEFSFSLSKTNIEKLNYKIDLSHINYETFKAFKS